MSGRCGFCEVAKTAAKRLGEAKPQPVPELPKMNQSSYPCQQAVEAHRVVRRRDSHIFKSVGTQMAVRLSDLRIRRPLPPRKIPGTHFYQRLSRSQGHSATARIRSIEKSSGLIGNRIRDLPVCSIVPQPTTLPRTPKFLFLIFLFVPSF
jgi:hypothetical protein